MSVLLLKSLFHKLVDACDGSEAAAAELGVSGQCIRALYDPKDTNGHVPNILKHVLPLQKMCGRPIVTDGLSAFCVPEQTPMDRVAALSDQLNAAIKEARS